MKQSHRQAATAAPGAGPVEGPAWTPGLVSYMTPESESSLYRNGKVFTRRDRDGNDAGYEGVVTEELAVAIGDDPGRGAADQAVGCRRRPRALGRGVGRRGFRRGPGSLHLQLPYRIQGPRHAARCPRSPEHRGALRPALRLKRDGFGIIVRETGNPARRGRPGRKNTDLLRAHPQRVPPRTQRLVPATAAAADRAGHRARRRTLPQAAGLARQDRGSGHHTYFVTNNAYVSFGEQLIMYTFQLEHPYPPHVNEGLR